MYAQLGDIIFEGLYGPEKHIRKDKVSLPRHNRINRRPKNQFTGVELGELKLEIQLHNAFIDVEVAIEQFREYRESATALRYITGSGSVFGTWLIESTKEKHKQWTSTGDIVLAKLELTLIETTSSSPESVAKSNAFASTANSPTPALVPLSVLPANMGVSAALDISAVRSLSSVADIEVRKLSPAMAISRIESAIGAAGEKVNTAKQKMSEAAAKVQAFEAMAVQAVDYVDNMYTVVADAQTMEDYINGFDPGDPVGSLHNINTANTQFMSSVGVMTNTSSPVAAFTGTRR